MKVNVKFGLLALLLTTSVSFAADPTDTTLYFQDINEVEANAGKDPYGASEYNRSVAIETTNFEVKNFWQKFSWSGDGKNQKNFAKVRTSAVVRALVEAGSTCKDQGLSEEGCSGQRPFLINQSLLSNGALSYDDGGTTLLKVPFDSASNYTSARDDAFFALDVFRDGVYTDGNVTTTSKNFGGFLDDLLGGTVNILLEAPDPSGLTLAAEAAVDLRNRYMANIIYGHQQTYRLAESSAIYTGEINTANSSKRVSLLDYSDTLHSGTTGCSALGVINLNDATLTCQLVNFLGLTTLLPSVLDNSADDINVKIDLVAEDTETALLKLGGMENNDDYLDGLAANPDPAVNGIVKPVLDIVDSLVTFLIGGTSDSQVQEAVGVEFIYDNPIALTFEVTADGNSVAAFQNFNLHKLESVYLSKPSYCKVRKTETTATLIVLGIVTETSEHVSYQEYSIDDLPDAETQEWLDWCQVQQNQNNNGLLSPLEGTVGDLLSGNVSQVLDNVTDLISSLIDTILSIGATIDVVFSVEEYQETIHKGLILHLEKVDELQPETNGTTTKYKITDLKRGS